MTRGKRCCRYSKTRNYANGSRVMVAKWSSCRGSKRLLWICQIWDLLCCGHWFLLNCPTIAHRAYAQGRGGGGGLRNTSVLIRLASCRQKYTRSAGCFCPPQCTAPHRVEFILAVLHSPWTVVHYIYTTCAIDHVSICVRDLQVVLSIETCHPASNLPGYMPLLCSYSHIYGTTYASIQYGTRLPILTIYAAVIFTCSPGSSGLMPRLVRAVSVASRRRTAYSMSP